MKKAILLVILILSFLLVGCTSATKAEFKQEEITVTVGEVFSPEVIVRPKRFEYRLYSGNNTILQVDGNNVTALQTGNATITLECGDKKDTLKVHVLSGSQTDINSPTFPDAANITFSVINYQSAQLETDVIRVLFTVAGTDITNSFPTLKGYSLAWFVDENGTVPIPGGVMAVKGDTTYYAIATELNNYVMVDENGYVTGLAYPNLKHSVYAFPESYNETTIRGIADYAFYGDVTLETIVIPKTYTYIGKFAFAGCTALKSVRFAEGSELTEIGDFAFGPTYTEPEEEEEEEEDDTLAYLDSLLDTFGLTQLKPNPTTEEETKINEDYCASLTMTLPASVKSIGSYAFYNCSALKTTIPENLETIGYGAFRGSNIEVADLRNVRKIEAYAFYDCKKLTEVVNTEKVTSCGGYAFAGTPLYENQIKSKKAVYAGTIAIGSYTGKDRINLLSGTTLIADYAFSDKKLYNLTVYFNAGQKVIIGWQAFCVAEYVGVGTQNPIFSEDVFLVVGAGEGDSYRAENYLLSDRFGERVEIDVTDLTDVNYGHHVLFKMADGKYVYDKFTPVLRNLEPVQPTEIDLSTLSHGNDIYRINSFAFESLSELKTIRLARVTSVAEFAVSDCEKLSLIDLSNLATGQVELRSSISFQFSTFASDCIILVTEGNYSSISSAWSERTTARNRLRYYANVTFYVDGVVQTEEEWLLPYFGEITGGPWYLDEECSDQCTTIPAGTTKLYSKTAE